MSVELNKAVVERLYREVFNQGKIDVLPELAVEAYLEHDPLPGQGIGLNGLRDRVEALLRGLQPQFTLEDIISENDKVVVRWTNRGTNVGEFLGIPPTGKSFAIAGIDIYRLRDGKMVEHWHVVDLFSQMQQLGLLPMPSGADKK
jgi:steroid delta-isomerase-like uncharacterized protein